jgi:hypothetical protein
MSGRLGSDRSYATLEVLAHCCPPARRLCGQVPERRVEASFALGHVDGDPRPIQVYVPAVIGAGLHFVPGRHVLPWHVWLSAADTSTMLGLVIDEGLENCELHAGHACESVPTCSYPMDRVDRVNDNRCAQGKVAGRDLVGNDITDGSDGVAGQTTADDGGLDVTSMRK